MSSLAPGLLVAAPALTDPNFERSVVLLASHGEEGAFGWVLNGRRIMALDELIAHVGLEQLVSAPGIVQLGGPVSRDQVWLLYRTEDRFEELRDQIDVGRGVTASPSQRVLEAVALSGGPASLRGVMGSAGWAPAQLESEIARGTWLPTPLDPTLVFDTAPEEMWAEAFRQVGTSPMAFTTRVVGQA